MSDYEKLSDRELDAAVAEKVMHFEVRRGVATPGDMATILHEHTKRELERKKREEGGS